MSWRPFLPEPEQQHPYCYGRWGFRSPGAVLLRRDERRQLLDALGEVRSLVERFCIPPRQFQWIARDGRPWTFGVYYPCHDAVAVNWVALGRCKADSVHYYRVLLHELLHATGHARRLNRQSLVDDRDERWRVNGALEEGTVLLAEALVLEAIGLPARVLEGHAPVVGGLMFSRTDAEAAAAWLLG